MSGLSKVLCDHLVIPFWISLVALFYITNAHGQVTTDSIVSGIESARFAGDFQREHQVLEIGMDIYPNESEIIWRYARMLVEHANSVDISQGNDHKKAKKDTLEMAIDYAELSIQADTNNPNTYYMMAIAVAAQTKGSSYGVMIRNAAKIKQNIEKTIKLSPRHHRALHVLGRWHFEVANVGSFLIGLAEINMVKCRKLV